MVSKGVVFCHRSRSRSRFHEIRSLRISKDSERVAGSSLLFLASSATDPWCKLFPGKNYSHFRTIMSNTQRKKKEKKERQYLANADKKDKNIQLVLNK